MEEKDIDKPIEENKIVLQSGSSPLKIAKGDYKIAPTKKGQVQGKSLAAMEEQTDIELAQIQQQVDLLVAKAKKIKERVDVSRTIHSAEMGFEPRVGRLYHLYQKENEQYVLSIIAPQEWNGNMPYNKFIASVRLLADHTWDILD